MRANFNSQKTVWKTFLCLVESRIAIGKGSMTITLFAGTLMVFGYQMVVPQSQTGGPPITGDRMLAVHAASSSAIAHQQSSRGLFVLQLFTAFLTALKITSLVHNNPTTLCVLYLTLHQHSTRPLHLNNVNQSSTHFSMKVFSSCKKFISTNYFLLASSQ